MTAPQPSPPPAKDEGADPRGLSKKEKRIIAVILFVGVALAAALMLFAPGRLVNEQDYPCPPAAPPASSQAAAASGLSASCLGRAGSDGIDNQALSQARTATRTSLGVLSAGLLAGAGALIGVVVSNHNAALTRDANETTKTRDAETATRERERAADERFTTAIEQLGHASASVRLGAMHSLHRLGESHPERQPTVVDVLCAYLRQPFHHPHHDWNSNEHPTGTQQPARAWWPDNRKERDERDGEREVRSTAARLMPNLLPPGTTPLQDGEASRSPDAGEASQSLEINLDGAMLDGLDLSGRRTGGLRLNGAYIDGDLVLGPGARIGGDLQLNNGAHITGGLWLDPGTHIIGGIVLGPGSHIDGRLHLGPDVHIISGLWLTAGTHIDGGLHLDADAHIDGRLHLGPGAYITGDLQLRDAHITGGLWLDDDAYITGDLTLLSDAHIDGGLHLGSNAHVDRDLHIGRGAYIEGDLHLGPGAYITGDLQLGPDARITGYLQLDPGAHIDGELQVAETATAREVVLHREAAMDRAWFQGWDVPLQ